MKRSSTIVYAVNDFEKREIDFYNADEILSSEKFSDKYSDVTGVLNKALQSPRNSVLRNVLNAARKA